MVIKGFLLQVVWFFLIVSSSSYASVESEQKKYDKLQDKWLYKSYYKLSKKTIKGITKVYNLQADETKQVNSSNTHALLAFMWSMGVNKKFAIADSSLANKNADSIKEQYIAQTVLTIAMYNRGWTELAKDMTQKSQHNPEFSGLSEKFHKEQLFANLMIGSLAIREGDLKVTQEAFNKIALATDKPWLPSLAKTATLAANGSILDAIANTKTLLADPTLTAYEREQLEQLKEKLTKDGSTGESMDIAQLVDRLIFDSIKTESNQAYQQLISQLSDYIENVS
ncbi:hypothetical protein [Thalassotalea sp. PLHSN55]|uniref:hypothetical protein n=1 Tax=Thalassotalea sp. PLHSN55 TaxID=3435888 RepID=UPI003F86192A